MGPRPLRACKLLMNSVFSLSFSSAGKGQFLTGSFLKQLIWFLVNLQEVAGGKNYFLLLLEAVNFTSYRLIRRTLLTTASFNIFFCKLFLYTLSFKLK